ncbi:MAG: efflux transporter periplasmic adaptor subunit [Flavobacterium sp. BFFFF1]|uniref:efflux RND transporter periplasmic adaptor subunit n=1 Tax=Flavobacterium sp. BFFFF1 TaxID=2015557 RepID=UPI000BC6F391|nr:efflux RND transporter periplasmic adaptor subunit [Flavobacterium sp. BFFFF1]OYU79242.1 MAG: efflux transporter periplasmic adaptor subunit [Flavobacterium sp. BFFFF1]
MKIKYIVYGALIIGISALIFYRIRENKSENDKSKDPKGKNKSTTVNGIVIVPQTFNNNLSLSGSIEANEQVEIRSEVSGIVEGIYFTEGASVRKGQVLFKVNDVELRAQLRQQETKENLASENERRAGLLLKKEAISQEEYDIARADFKSAQAQTQLIRAQIGKTSVRAPFSGKVGLRSISPGTYLTPDILVAKLVNISQLKITFSIPEKYAGQMKLNAPLTFTVAGSKAQYTAKVYAIEPEIAVATRTLQIRAIADNKDGKLLPGTFADIELPLQQINDAIVIPSEAIVPVQDGKKVFTVQNGKAKENKVETETRTDKDVLILSGLKAGDTVLTSGVMSLKQDAPVKVKLTKK